jgi:hypothetical protein
MTWCVCAWRDAGLLGSPPVSVTPRSERFSIVNTAEKAALPDSPSIFSHR